jgi:hypothetical protein
LGGGGYRLGLAHGVRPGWVHRPGWGYRPGYGWRPGYGYGWGSYLAWYGLGAAFAAYPYYEDIYYEPAPPVVDEAVAYCMRRFRSYDPVSQTYRGYDGRRHPCP